MEPDYVLEKDGEWIAKLYCGDFLDVMPIIGVSAVDMVLTDPPYHKQYLSYWGDLSRLSSEVMRVGSLLITLVGHHSLML